MGVSLMGPTGIELSLISRRSELRSLKRQLIELESRIESVTANVKELAAAVKNQEAECETLLHGTHDRFSAALQTSIGTRKTLSSR